MTILKVGIIIDSMLFVLILLIQFILYPAFRWIERDKFTDWHRRYTFTISFFVIPLMFAQVAALGYLLFSDFNLLRLVAASGVVVAWFTTAVGAAPLHLRLGSEYSENAVDRLLKWNFVRVAGWTLTWVCNLIAIK